MGSSVQESEAAARAVMERYVDALYRGDVATIKALFHPDAFMGGYLGDNPLLGGPEPFLSDIGSRPSMADSNAPYRAEISHVEVRGRAATVTLNETGFFGSTDFINYFALLQIEGEWKIVSKSFATL